MKRALFIFAILGLTTVVAFGQVIRENRQPTPEFTQIAASSVFNITVHRGNVHSLVIEVDAAVLPYVDSRIIGNELSLTLTRELENIEILNAIIVMPYLEAVFLDGASRLTATGLFTPDRFIFNGRGDNSLSINVNTNQLGVNVTGSSNVEINANVSGHAAFHVSGTATISGYLATNIISIHYRGVGNVTLIGSAAHGFINASGVPVINLVNFPIREALVTARDVANITVNATHTLGINASGVSTVRYTGAATVMERNGGSMSSVYRIQ